MPKAFLKLLFSNLRMKLEIFRLSLKFKSNIHYTAIIVYDDITRLHLNNINIGPYTTIYCTSEYSKGSIAELHIGEETYIGEMNNIRVAGSKITIGKKCLIAQHVNIIGSNHSILKGEYIMDQLWDDKKLGVTIEDDVWIGCGATILPGVIIGKGAIVGAGSVVTKNVEPYTIVGGNPARFIKNRT